MQTDYSHTPGLGFPAVAFRNLGLPGYALTFFYGFPPSRKNTVALFTSPRSRHAIIRVGTAALMEWLQVTLPNGAQPMPLRVVLSLFRGK